MNNFERMKINESQFSADDLKKHFRYDCESGKLFWIRHHRRTDIVGLEAGSKIRVSGIEYLNVGIGMVKLKVHRVIWCMHYGDWPQNLIDHEDGDGLNNRISNLRDATNQENARNVCARKSVSGHRGVHWHKEGKRWHARIGVNGKDISLGLYSDINDAIAARLSAEIEYGFHPNNGRKR